MALDVIDLQTFYGSPVGQVARRILSARLRSIWPDLRGQALAGIGYANAYLAIFRDEAERTLALMPASQGVTIWPRTGPSASALVDPFLLPLSDDSLDRVIIVHALEVCGNPRELLSEIWQTLKPGGRIIVIAPNRRGLWARLDTTPFGQGQPFSRAQLTGLLREALFTPELWTEALFVPPLNRALVLRSAVAFERTGHALSLPFAGIHLIEAVKQVYRVLPVSPARKSRARLVPTLAPTRVSTG
ncbi:Methyltransferase domain-containing protein [Rhizobiales bacterium GAS191]|nr:Methyltransferase domain-containing protein [Rhizobiales bacterium GAS113]SEB94109.1 Methyltransferase domain-containing protein [Rhizobiales bacterium GAS191]SED24116.1 Methyltransferase domain-containing protein [Rhizobiales bacterium GAS188]